MIWIFILRLAAKNYFEKEFFKLKNNSVFRKTKENVRKYREKRREKRGNYLVSEQSYHTTRFFTENLLAARMKKKQLECSRINMSIWGCQY